MAVSLNNILRKIEDASSWYLCAILLLAMILLSSSFEDNNNNNNNNLFYDDPSPSSTTTSEVSVGRHINLRQACDEIYVVREGETLHTISDKCGDPFIVEQNPHIHDPDDVFPGLVIKITPNSNRV